MWKVGRSVKWSTQGFKSNRIVRPTQGQLKSVCVCVCVATLSVQMKSRIVFKPIRRSPL